MAIVGRPEIVLETESRMVPLKPNLPSGDATLEGFDYDYYWVTVDGSWPILQWQEEAQ